METREFSKLINTINMSADNKTTYVTQKDCEIELTN